MNKECIYQIALTRVKGLGPVRQRRLIEHFGNAEAVFKAKRAELTGIEGLGQIAVNSILSFSNFKTIEAEIKQMKAKNISTHFFTEDSYPNRLRFCNDAPSLIYTVGKVDFNRQKFVAIVGTRRATNYGKRFITKIMEGLAACNITLVSGLALGIDIYAHREALKYKLQNIAVLAHGLNRIYPSEHRETARRIVSNGAIVSEYPLGTEPDRENFPERNRIIAGLVDALIIVESKRQGGAMITAEIADSYHRDVFAAPGKIEDPMSAGCNFLIKQNKARLIESSEDILWAMNWKEQKTRSPRSAQKKLFLSLSKRDEQIVKFLKEKGASHTEEIALMLGTSTSQLALHMLELEMNGLVKSQPGSLYSLC